MVKFISFIMSLLISILSFFGVKTEMKAFRLSEEKLDANISSSQQARLESGKLMGAHIIVNQADETVFNKVFGSSSAAGEALTDNAMYRIASMTKPVTAVALLIEYDRGSIDINADVADYLPQFGEMYLQSGEKAKNSIKVYQLVSHTSGIGDVSLSGDALKNCTVQKAMEHLAEQPLHFEPGTKQEYSTGAFDVAAAIIENVSGLEFSEYLKVNIFDKLGMKDTTFEPTDEQWSRFVKVHDLKDGKVVDSPTADGCVFGGFPATYHAAGAALASTADDYTKFAQMLLNNGKAPDGTVIMSEKAVELMRTPVVDNTIMPGDQKWGLGVRVITGTGNTLPKGAFGWSGAYGSHFWIDPTNKIAAVYMKNSAYDGGAGNMTANEFEKDVMNSLTLKFIK